MKVPAAANSTGGQEASAQVWYCMQADAVVSALGTNRAEGLSAGEAGHRLASHGQNMLPEAARRSLSRMIIDQFADFMILVLIAAAVISGIVGDAADTVAIVVIVVLNATIGFIQEYRAEKAMAALKKMAAPVARVLRDGQVKELAAVQLVPGDVVLLEAGNVIPADLRLLEAVQLRCAEAALTGESQPVDKTVEPLAEGQLPLGDRTNMAYKGTLVAYGRGAGVVVATGLATELGRIARLLSGGEDVRTPLQKRLARFGGRLAWAVLAVCAIVLAAGLARGEPPMLMFLTAVSLAVAAIPEALPAVVTIALALGARRLVRQNALIRRLPAVETLGSITFICSDKTGTLTENRMRAEAFSAAGESDPGDLQHEPWPTLFGALALCNDANCDGDAATGDPTEIALLEAAAERGVRRSELEARQPRLAELPFDSTRKRMSTLHPDGDGVIAYVKGAPEAILERAAGQRTSAGLVSLDAQAVRAAADEMAARGLRVLAVACRRFERLPARLEDAEEELEFLGLVGLMDPPRPEAADAVAECRAAGIIPVMITGDHPVTATAIARRLGLVDGDGKVLTGSDLAQLDDRMLAERVRDVRIYARVDPEQKIRIVSALQERGEFVAMTGDGVNDAPALKRADIGVAMGKGGTDVAREAAHMVLLDDNFATIVHAVREGRRIYDNIRKFVKYTMTSNSGEIWTIFLAPFLGLPIPLLPIHILWINLVTDGLPGLALAKEPAGRDVMKRPPRPPQESIFAHGMWQHILWVGLLMAGVCLILQAWAYHDGTAHWQTMVFTVLTLSQLGHALAIRDEVESLFTIGVWSNKMFTAAFAFTFALQMATIYVPALNPIFKTEPLHLHELLLCLALSSAVFFGVEVEKWMVRRQLRLA